MSARRTTFGIPVLVNCALVAAVISGCGAPAQTGLFADDAADYDKIRDIRINVTTIDGVSGETYAAKAWQEASKPFKSPYHTLTEGELFGWAFLDELAAARKKTQLEAQRKADIQGKKKARAAREKLKKDKARQAKAAADDEVAKKKKAEVSRAAEAAKTEKTKKPVE